ncbi:MAG: TetR/AcrR family transcriptional regulator [Myxococcales bacterium]|nr:TetR/AcrR family transcriptional regulator [Myxococcales bacterium]
MSWERARQPEQKAERREAILQSAARCFDEGGLAGATLSAIAQGAGLSKANLYRYFESRDVVLLELLLRETTSWASHIEQALAIPAPDDVQAVARTIRVSLVERPRMCALSAVARPVLERQLTPAAIVDFKRRVVHGMGRAVAAVALAMPSLTSDQAFRFVRYTNLVLGQLWVAAHPAKALAEALSQPEFADRRMDFGATLEDFMVIALKGLLAETAQ